MKLNEIDRAVLAAHESGESWKTVKGIKRSAQFHRVLKRAQYRKSLG